LEGECSAKIVQYDELNDIINNDQITEREYYGNRTDYYIEYIEPINLFNKLENMGFDIESKIKNKQNNKKNNKPK